jgi:CRISPR-associated protein Csh2
MNTLDKKIDFVVFFTVKNANPNGDPMDENKPRIDEETEKNIVTDVRLKRTIRDFLYKFLDEEIFIVEEINKDGTQKTRENRLEELKISSKEDGVKLLENYVDLRLFGATIAVKNMPLTWIGPVQFKFGKSLHKVEPKTIKGTSVMPSKENVTRGTFIETQILPYSLISFYGIINENAAKKTGLTELDVDLMMNGLWNGTKNIITRSKIGQMPRLLLRVVYKEDNFHIGDLDKGIKLTFNENIEEKALRNISEVKLDISGLIDKIELNKDKIERIDFKINDLETTPTLKDSFEGIKLKELMF